uniref:Uncharacterized protein n=1 Tax=Mustela putorius furo TaxID=9669 RepID=M3XXD4_MUSPF
AEAAPVGLWGRASAWLPLGAEMPKKACATKKGKSQSKEPGRPLPPLGPVADDGKGCVTIAIHDKSGSKQNPVMEVTAQAVREAITAAPSLGEPNAQLCQCPSKVLELRKSDMVFDEKLMSRRINLLEKVVKLPVSTSAAEILEKLKQQVK